MVDSFALSGVDALPVEVQVAAESGYPSIALVGLPDTAVRESRERIQAAFRGLDAKLNERRFTVNLAPAELRKEGAAFDLPIALGLLLALKRIRPEALRDIAAAGELTLDGGIRPVRGALAFALQAARLGKRGIILPQANVPETDAIAGVPVYAARTLQELLHQIESGALSPVERQAGQTSPMTPVEEHLDLRWVRGQAPARRALEIAAAGGHNVLFSGPPGSGKTLLARCLPGILPELNEEEALEVTLVHSVAGRLPAGVSRLRERPFRAPHHTITSAGLVGGGLVPRPGEVSLAHFGVLFLDEMPEFRREVLNLLRQPVEEGALTLVRLGRSVRIPCRFMLVGAMNPCPCGFLGHPRRACRCTPCQVNAYLARIGGPLLDRVDLHVNVPALPARDVASTHAPDEECSNAVRARVVEARERQRRRLGLGQPTNGAVARATAPQCNAQMGQEELQQHCKIDAPSQALLEKAVATFSLSARGVHRTLRVARTIADLEGSEHIERAHLAEAAHHRVVEQA